MVKKENERRSRRLRFLRAPLYGLAALCTGILSNNALGVPLNTLEGLQSVSVFERTGSLQEHVFAINSSELNTRLPSLFALRNDFQTNAGEFYDVFISNESGSFDQNGEFVTIEGIFDNNSGGGGFNIAETRLDFSDGTFRRGLSVTHFRSKGEGAFPELVPNAVDGDLTTHTLLGESIDQNDRLSITINFFDTAATIPIFPVQVKNLDSDSMFFSEGELLSIPDPNIQNSLPIGTVQDFSGVGTVARTDGTVEPLAPDVPIFLGDIIETDNSSSTVINFVDDTNIPINGSARLAIDEYIFDPTADDNVQEFSWLRGLFKLTSGLIGRDQPDDIENLESTFGVGIRGSAESIVREDLLNNPQPLFGDAGIFFDTGSAVELSSFINSSESEFVLSFDYIFLNQEGELSVFLGLEEIFSDFASPSIEGLIQTAEIFISSDQLINELVFTFDGPTGVGMVLTNLVAPGVSILNFDSWFISGAGVAQPVYLTTEEQILSLISAAEARSEDTIITSVPEPRTMMIFLVGLGVLILIRQRRRSFRLGVLHGQ